MHDEAVAVLYRAAARAVHPDRGGSDALMAKVNLAAEVLRACPGHLVPYRPPESWPPGPDSVVPFGRHRGLLLRDLPAAYLAWMSREFTDEAWRAAAATVLARTAAA